MPRQYHTYIVKDFKLLITTPNGSFYTDVLSFDVDYRLNALPHATIIVPLGRELTTLKLSHGYALTWDITRLHKAYLFVNIEYKGEGNPNPYTVGNCLVFAGYIVNTSVGHEFGRNILTITLSHWLSDLTFASVLANPFYPGVPFRIGNPIKAAFINIGNYFHPFKCYGFVPASVALFIDPLYLATSVWFQGIYPLLRGVLDQGIFGLNSSACTVQALSALNKCGGTRLALNTHTFLYNISAASFALAEDLIKIFDPVKLVEALSVGSIWDVILTLSEELLFDIVPYPSKYKVIPRARTLSAYFDPLSRGATITNDEILSFTYNSERTRQAKRAVVVSVKDSATSIADFPEAGLDTFSYGSFSPVGIITCGEIEHRTAPPFVEKATNPSFFSRFAMGGFGQIRAINFTMRPAIPIDPLNLRTLLALNLQQRAEVLNKLAHYYYVELNSQYRTAVVVCPFRRDIAPGSPIAIWFDNDYFLPEFNLEKEEQHKSKLYGTVEGVRYYMAFGEAPKAVYTLRGLRCKDEYFSPNYSIAMHPLYMPAFGGDIHLL